MVLRLKLGGRFPRKAGSNRVARTNAYRSSPAIMTHGPALPSRQAQIDMTRINSASVSMSKRAPKALDMPVRRASQPSSASRLAATAATASTTSCTAPSACSKSRVSRKATSIARATVVWLAAPKQG